MTETIYADLKQLGGDVKAPQKPDEAVLEKVHNPRPNSDYVVRLVCPEFTSLCPVTGQPDFAHIVIDYVPGDLLVESKSFKLWMQSFRNHNDFHEACTVGIAERLFDELSPKYLRIGGYWYPRGGIPLDIFCQKGDLPQGIWLPDQGVQPYRGRG